MNIKKRGKLSILPSNSKSQAAIFLVITAIVILSGVLYFFYQRQAVEQEVEIVQPELAPIKLYVDNCIKSVAENGLETIGLSGGYIDIPQNIDSNPEAYLTTFPGAGFKLPYWWHDGLEAVPSEAFISQQLTNHIQTELSSCISNFEPFSGKFEVNELKNPIVDVKFNENDVSVALKYQLEIISKEGDFRAVLENFKYTIPIRFKKVYELAKLIMERENKDYFLEKRTIDLYSMDTEIPTTDVEATCNAKTWQLSSIMGKLKTLLRVNLPYIRIKGTDYNPNSYVPNPKGRSIYSQTYFQQHYIWDIDNDADKKYNNMKVAFSYDNWPLNIYARPSQNGILRSNSQKGTGMISFFCMHLWHFTYDINYPVQVSVFDQETDKNKAYQFNFAFEVAIDHNQPSRVNKGTTLFDTEDAISSDDYCNDVQNEITIFTVNNATGEDIRDVNLTFVCGRFYCDIGATNWLSFGAASGLAKRLPYCVNGIIKGNKQGFEEAKSFVQTDVDGRSYVLGLNPVKEFKNYRVVKHLLSNPSIVNDLAPNEKASITIKGKDTSFDSFAVYPKEVSFPLRIPDNKDATYEVNIYLADNENIVGGYIGDWKISKDALRSAGELVFHVVEQGAASEDERLLFVSGLSSYSKNVPAPELK
ncbi:hypothetical protein J4234_01370 [Candidatus Woesearchaeota archaeon]|nr:hypothetical protein [Candidatus Woesearchaeota archaeon]